MTVSTEQVSRDVVVASAAGLHARPAAVVVQAAAGLDVPVMIAKGELGPVRAASILRLLSLHAEQGETVTVSATGPGALEAVEHIVELIGRELDDFDDETGSDADEAP